MPSLHRIQQSFAASLMRGDDAAITPHLVENGVNAPDRLDIYRNNVRENFRAALAAGFPVLQRLVGDAYFAQMANAYRQKYPSMFGNLNFIGARLSTFLEREMVGTEFEYFGDVAQLEWLCQESASAADAVPFSIAKLACIDAADYLRLHLQLHPGVRLLNSRYPLLQIWYQNQPENDAAGSIDLSSGGDRLLIHCTEDSTELRRLSAGEYAFLEALQSDRPLQSASALALAAQPDFDLTNQLRAWVSLQVISSFLIP